MGEDFDIVRTQFASFHWRLCARPISATTSICLNPQFRKAWSSAAWIDLNLRSKAGLRAQLAWKTSSGCQQGGTVFKIMCVDVRVCMRVRVRARAANFFADLFDTGASPEAAARLLSQNNLSHFVLAVSLWSLSLPLAREPIISHSGHFFLPSTFPFLLPTVPWKPIHYSRQKKKTTTSRRALGSARFPSLGASLRFMAAPPPCLFTIYFMQLHKAQYISCSGRQRMSHLSVIAR